MSNTESYVGLRVGINILLNSDQCGSWLLNEPVNGPICFHHVNEGECTLSVDEKEPIRLKSGDFVVFTRFTKHSLTPCRGTVCEEGALSLDEPVTSIICGIASPQNTMSNSIIHGLPPYFFIGNENSFEGYELLNEALKIENKINGKNAFNELHRMLELLFVMSVRHMLASKGNRGGGNVNILPLNPKLQSAVIAMQQNPERAWTLSQLAKVCGMSRTVFSSLFRQAMGITATEFLFEWRMKIAWELLLSSRDIINTACRVGYQSESAFSNAFYRYHGIRPGKVKLLQQEAS